MTNRSQLSRTFAVLATLPLLAACEPSEPAPEQETLTTTKTTSPSDSETTQSKTSESKEPAQSTTPKTMTGSVQATPASITDIRTGSHQGFDRLVIQFEGGTPEPVADYTAEPRQQGSGQLVEVPGNAVIGLSVDNVQRSDRAVGEVAWPSGGITGVNYQGVYEARAQFFIGVDGQRPFEVKTLADPPRVVVDIQR